VPAARDGAAVEAIPADEPGPAGGEPETEVGAEVEAEPVEADLAADEPGAAADTEAAGTAGEPTPTLDPAVFEDLLTLGQDFVAGLVTTYLETAPERIAGLKDAVRTADLDTVARLAHALKGSSAAMAAQHLAALCSDIERAAKYGAGTVPELVARADLEYARVVDALHAVVPDVPTKSLLPRATSAWDSWDD
jgi:HPt (histidine-containing phosphotransfer) domain-containing protein